jgi:hypothetical protein
MNGAIQVQYKRADTREYNRRGRGGEVEAGRDSRMWWHGGGLHAQRDCGPYITIPRLRRLRPRLRQRHYDRNVATAVTMTTATMTTMITTVVATGTQQQRAAVTAVVGGSKNSNGNGVG